MDPDATQSGVVTILCVLTLAAITHIGRPPELEGVDFGGSVRKLIRVALPAVELLLAVTLGWASWRNATGLVGLALAASVMLFGAFSLYLEWMRRRATDVTDCECTAFGEPVSRVGVARALAITCLAVALLAAGSDFSASVGWTWAAGVTGGLLLTFAPTPWNMEIAHLQQLRREHELAYSESRFERLA